MSNKKDYDDEIDLAEIFHVLWARKLFIAAFMVGFVIIGFLYAKSQTPIFQSTALVQLEERSSGGDLPAELQSLMGSGSGGRAATEIEILKSRSVASDAVNALGLHIDAAPRALPFLGNIFRHLGVPHFGTSWLKAYSWQSETIEVGVLRVRSEWIGEEIVVVKTNERSFDVELPDGSSLSGQVGTPVAGGEDFALRVDALTGPVGREYIVSSRDPVLIATELSEDLGVAEVGRQSSILRLTYRHPDRAMASGVLDAVMAAYVRQNIQRGAASAEKSLQFIQDRLPDAEAQVQAAQLALNSYQRSVSSVDLTFETQQVLSSAAEIETQLNDLKMQQAELALDVTPNHPSYKRLEENRVILEERLATIREETQGLPEQQLEVFNLNRDLQVAQEIYQSLLQRRQELQVVRASTIGNIRVIDNALTERFAVAPRTKIIVMLAAVLGLITGVGAILVPRMLRRTVDGVEDLENLGLSVFASVGFSKLADQSSNKNKTMSILAVDRPTDLSVEALRSLRTSMHFGMIDAKSQSLAITSPAPGVGKTFICVNLAAVMAQAGTRVVVIDADLRRGVLRKYFNCPRDTNGLSEVLADDVKLEEVIRKGPIENLFYVTSGRYPPNPSELLMRPKVEQVIKQLSEQFDFVIVDAPPILAVTDPVILSKYVGATMIAARHKVTAAPELEAAIRIFEAGGGKFIGAILNCYKAEASGKGGYYYYYNKRYAYDDKGSKE
ncbi:MULTISPECIES: polysaccharide biosynthesis tyrosine autokinase [unclassified Aliiroseovarius]|uniref:polysaccharide biosynthesis tyrosine autokinase n=1 Tax=unclassified Aliiroseovarius TaxID=2623558 RepID=UPI0015687A76|nr:putative tyrosine-protein kinase in cps region [Aliiroseovarius sp. xm-m-314]NRP81609.1 putative tyrosine-protein kinase in cps region [Aliiroseovarius sp. xm-v-209]